MSQTGINYMLNLLSMSPPQIFYDFNEPLSGNIIPSIYAANPVYSGTIFGNTGTFYSGANSGSGFFTGSNYVQINQVSPLTGDATLFFVYNKPTTGGGVLFSSLTGITTGNNFASGYLIGINDANRIYFEYYSNSGPVVITSNNVYAQQNAIAVTVFPGNISFNYYDFNLKQLDIELFSIDSQYLLSSNEWFLGRTFANYLPSRQFTGYMDHFLYFNSVIPPGNMKRLFSGVYASPTSFPAVSGTVTSTGIIGYNQIVTGTIGSLYFQNTFAGFSNLTNITNGLRLWLQFQNTGSNTIYDSSTGNNTGIAINPVYVTGSFGLETTGNAFYFNGTGNEIIMDSGNNPFNFQSGQAFTVSFWSSGIFSGADTGYNTGTPWQFAVYEIDTHGNGSGFLNGQLIQTTLISSITGSIDSGVALYIGASNFNPFGSSGAIGDFRIYNRDLTSGEIQTLYNESGGATNCGVYPIFNTTYTTGYFSSGIQNIAITGYTTGYYIATPAYTGLLINSGYVNNFGMDYVAYMWDRTTASGTTDHQEIMFITGLTNLTYLGNQSTFDKVIGEFAVNNNYPSGNLNVFLNGAFQVESGYLLTGLFYNQLELPLADYYTQQNYLVTNNFVSGTDTEYYDYNQQQNRGLLPNQYVGNLLINETQIYNFYYSYVFLNGQKLISGLDFFITTGVGGSPRFSGSSGIQVPTGNLCFVNFYTGANFTTGNYDYYVTGQSKFTRGSTIYWLNGIRIDPSTYIETSKVDLLTGQNIFDSGIVNLDNIGEGPLYWNTSL